MRTLQEHSHNFCITTTEEKGRQVNNPIVIIQEKHRQKPRCVLFYQLNLSFVVHFHVAA